MEFLDKFLVMRATKGVAEAVFVLPVVHSFTWSLSAAADCERAPFNTGSYLATRSKWMNEAVYVLVCVRALSLCLHCTTYISYTIVLLSGIEFPVQNLDGVWIGKKMQAVYFINTREIILFHLNIISSYINEAHKSEKNCKPNFFAEHNT